MFKIPYLDKSLSFFKTRMVSFCPSTFDMYQLFSEEKKKARYESPDYFIFTFILEGFYLC